MTITEITDAQIRNLRTAAIEAGDYAQADICDRAMATDAVDQDGNEIARADLSRDEARAICAAVIEDARAAAEEVRS